ncbi:MAG: SAM-dependent methyltransferase [Deltaproteobacteria bacterium]|nr:MAG: SAM-dependent methyltransferase [Deltaproteobacteria bacterium]
MADGRLDCQPARNNCEPILGVLRKTRLPAASPRRILEIASGSGVHCCYLATNLPDVLWQPTDYDPEALGSIDAWRATEGAENLLPAKRLDVLDATWPERSYEAVVCINMVHAAPWAVTEALMAVAARSLVTDGVLFMYGAYRDGGAYVGAGDQAFDDALRLRDPEWGLRDVLEVKEVAANHGLVLEERVTMPKDNLSLIFRQAV